MPGTRILSQTVQERTDSESVESGGRKYFGARHGFKVCKGAHYLGGYIRDDNPKKDWQRAYTDVGE